MNRTVSISMSSLAGFCLSYGTPEKVKYRQTTVCEVPANPKKFDGMMVLLVANYESDGIERSGLVDNRCSRYAIAVSAPEHFAGEEDLKKVLVVGQPGA